jgi:hypothetical protein
MSKRSFKEKKLLKAKILEILKDAEQPLSVDAIRTRAGATSWHSVNSLLFELVAEGKIAGLKSSKAWIFGMPEMMKVIKIEQKIKNGKGGEKN